MRRLLVVAAPLLVAAAPLVNAARAQRPVAVRVSADNDAFDFWVPPWDRPDQEYTSGVRGTLEYAGGVDWWPWRRLAADSQRARTHAFSLGQAIYTRAPGPAPNALGVYGPEIARRPNAGWLYLEAAQRDSGRRSSTELSVALGVVGTPALAEPMQRFFHSLGPEYQRPVDWSEQLPFEPGFIARYTRSDLLQPFGDGDRLKGGVTSEFSGALGTILTEATAGAGLGADLNAGRVPGTAAPLHVVVSLGAKGRAVIRDEFLDGTFFRSSQAVNKETLVFEARGSLTLRWRQIGVTYRANHASRQYSTQAKPTSWGTLETEWRFGR